MDLLELAGVGLVVAAAATVSSGLAMFAGGVFLLAMVFVVERRIK